MLWEGYRESRRCSKGTCPESYITKYTSIRTFGHVLKRVFIDCFPPEKVDRRLPGKGNSNSHGARPVYENYLDD